MKKIPQMHIHDHPWNYPSSRIFPCCPAANKKSNSCMNHLNNYHHQLWYVWVSYRGPIGMSLTQDGHFLLFLATLCIHYTTVSYTLYTNSKVLKFLPPRFACNFDNGLISVYSMCMLTLTRGKLCLFTGDLVAVLCILTFPAPAIDGWDMRKRNFTFLTV